MFKGRKRYNNPYYSYIENPIQCLKHLVGCQNWSEIEYLNFNWGKEEVDTGILVNEGAEMGSFWHSGLSDVTQHKISRQITSESEAWTDSLIQSLCEDFFILNYQDSGYESVVDVLALQTPSETISFLDCKSIGEVKDNEEMYCTPVLKYGYDQLSNTFKKEIRITNTWQTIYDSSYVTGVSNPEIAEQLWNKYKEIYDKCGIINEMPTNLQEKKWFAEESTAIWYLTKLYNIMKMSKISIEVNYIKGRLYKLGQHVYLTLPNHTNDSPIECVIEKFDKDKNSDSVRLDLLMLEKINVDEFEPIMTFNNSTEDDEESLNLNDSTCNFGIPNMNSTSENL